MPHAVAAEKHRAAMWTYPPSLLRINDLHPLWLNPSDLSHKPAICRQHRDLSIWSMWRFRRRLPGHPSAAVFSPDLPATGWFFVVAFWRLCGRRQLYPQGRRFPMQTDLFWFSPLAHVVGGSTLIPLGFGVGSHAAHSGWTACV